MFYKYLINKRVLSTYVVKPIAKMNNNVFNYEAAIETLNKLQTNADYLKNAGSTNTHNEQTVVTLTQVKKYLSRIGLTLDKLDELSVIHVAGTKGKGSTCALCESILRHHGFKTGFFSSPHLLEVRERIRINGEPIHKEEFARHFFEIFNKLYEQRDDPNDMPLYFRFLTLMAFQYFFKEKVDVAIIEVGIGGEYDCTNVLRKVPVVGISSLGLDHTKLLGNTLDKIAWQKSGIMKKGSQVYTVLQPEEAMKVLYDRSIEKQCTLHVVDEHLHFPVPKSNVYPKDIFTRNASLATALAEAWIKSCNKNGNGVKALSPEITQIALNNSRWPGRYEVRQHGNIRFFLDGAHTVDSVEICARWFTDMVKQSKAKRVLMFNVIGDRDPESLLTELRKCHFDVVLFVSNVTQRIDNADYSAANATDKQILKCHKHKRIWLDLEKRDPSIPKVEQVEVFPSVVEGIEFLKDTNKSNLLTTGSIHLIGCVLNIIDPDLNNNLHSKLRRANAL